MTSEGYTTLQSPKEVAKDKSIELLQVMNRNNIMFPAFGSHMFVTKSYD